MICSLVGLNSGKFVRYHYEPPTLPPFVSLPANRYFLGDSQVSGHGVGNLTTNNWTAFNSMYITLGLGVTPNNTFNGVGGRGLYDTRLYHYGLWGASGAPRSGPEWVHFVETGGQDEPGQLTATQFGDTFEAYCRWIKLRSPNCIISTETPFSFGREAEPGRDWTLYGVEQAERIDILALDGIQVYLVDNNAGILALQNKLTPAQVWYQDGHPSEFHFTDLGNIMTGLLMLKTFGHDIYSVDFTAILAQGNVTQSQIDKCYEVLNGV